MREIFTQMAVKTGGVRRFPLKMNAGTSDAGCLPRLEGSGQKRNQAMNFLVNDYGGGEGCAVYREYYGSGSNAGQVRPLDHSDPANGGLYVDLSQPPFSFSNGTGVTVAPDGESLYFMTGINETGQDQTLIRTDLSTPNPNELGTWPISSSEIENIAILTMQQLKPERSVFL